MIERTVTVVEQGKGKKPFNPNAYAEGNLGADSNGKHLSDFCKASAIVLLAPSGMGKTTAFKGEVTGDANNAVFVTARDFLALGMPNLGERDTQGEKTLFIDGLDEIRAGETNSRPPFDRIRARIQAMGKPRFRLSCREADWLSSDLEHLEKVSKDGCVTVLRLDPLTDAHIKQIAHNHLAEPQKFIAQAEQHGLWEMMRNPQILTLFLQAVGNHDETWPNSKTEVYELAVEKAILEHNREHRDAAAGKFDPLPRQRQAAEFLCTLMLLADEPFFVQRAGDEAAFSHGPLHPLNSPEYDERSEFLGVAEKSRPYQSENGKPTSTRAASKSPLALESLDYEHPESLSAVAKSKLFSAEEGERKFTYIHRSVAEYLCASYLNRQLEHLPLSRVLALLTGTDGVPVSALRGVFAWLTTLSGQHRAFLMQWDPLGVILYGDLSQFSTNDIRDLLSHLKQSFASMSTDIFREIWNRNTGIAGLFTEDSFPVLGEALTSDDRSDAHRRLILCIIEAIGQTKPTLADTASDKHHNLMSSLLSIVRDESWSRFAREMALHALIECRVDASVLKALAEDIEKGKVKDTADALLGLLLEWLYLIAIPPQHILDYFRTPKAPGFTNSSYLAFWNDQLPQATEAAFVPVFLDTLTDREHPIHDNQDNLMLSFRKMIAALLAKGLQVAGEEIEASRLRSWLALGVDQWGTSRIGDREVQLNAIRQWLLDHPDRWRAVLNDFVGQHISDAPQEDQFLEKLHWTIASFQLAIPPQDIAAWSLEAMQKHLEKSFARYLFQYAYWGQNKNPELAQEIQSCAAMYPKVQGWLNESDLARQQAEEKNRERKLRLQELRNKGEAEKANFVQQIRDNVASIRDGLAPLHVFYQLGMAYFGWYVGFQGDTPKARLLNYFEDEQLVEDILYGLQQCVKREDFPSVAEVFNLSANGKVHKLSFALIAGINELTKEDPKKIATIDATTVETAIAVSLTSFTGTPFSWRDYIVQQMPEPSAAIWIKHIRLQLGSGEEHISMVHILSRDDKYKALAKLVAISALKGFPLRAKKAHLKALSNLLRAAYLHDRENLLPLVEKKLRRTSMEAKQYACWALVGAMLDPHAHLQTLEVSLTNNPRSSQFLIEILLEAWDENNLLAKLPSQVAAALIRLLITHDVPVELERIGLLSDENRVSDWVGGLINVLAARPTKDVSEILDDLLQDEELSGWHPALSTAAREQRVRWREAQFAHPRIEGVLNTLRNSSPSNAADLAALTVEVIRDLARNIRDGNTNDYRQYWSQDNKGGRIILTKRKSEGDCRDTFLSDLKQRLSQFSVNAEPEVRYADEKRSDIKVTYIASGKWGGDVPIEFNVPIEIKCNDHKGLWNSIREQLIAKYTRDPKTEGYGIYLVFWFGPQDTPSPPGGSKPRSAEELERMLRDSLTIQEQKLISVEVIDCSPPQPSSKNSGGG